MVVSLQSILQCALACHSLLGPCMWVYLSLAEAIYTTLTVKVTMTECGVIRFVVWLSVV